MDWTKLPTDLLIQRIQDNEFISIMKYQSLWALLERKPYDKEALRYMTNKQLLMACQWLDSIESQVNSDINQCKAKRDREKTNYLKNKTNSDFLPTEHTTDCTQTAHSLHRREEEIRKEKNKKEKIKESFDFGLLKEPMELWLDYKKEKGQSYKPIGLKQCYEKLVKFSNNNEDIAREIIENAIARNYAGFFEVKTNNKMQDIKKETQYQRNIRITNEMLAELREGENNVE